MGGPKRLAGRQHVRTGGLAHLHTTPRADRPRDTHSGARHGGGSSTTWRTACARSARASARVRSRRLAKRPAVFLGRLTPHYQPPHQADRDRHRQAGAGPHRSHTGNRPAPGPQRPLATIAVCLRAAWWRLRPECPPWVYPGGCFSSFLRRRAWAGWSGASCGRACGRATGCGRAARRWKIQGPHAWGRGCP